MKKGKNKRPKWQGERKRKPTGDQKFYQSKDWKRLRQEVIWRDYKCQECGEPYISGQRFQVDHIRAIQDGGSRWDLNNLQLLCCRCHDVKSAKEGIQRSNEVKNNIR